MTKVCSIYWKFQNELYSFKMKQNVFWIFVSHNLIKFNPKVTMMWYSGIRNEFMFEINSLYMGA